MNKNKTILVDSNNYIRDVDESNYDAVDTELDAISLAGASQIPDPIKYFSGNFWTADFGKLVKYGKNSLFSVEKTDTPNVYILRAKKDKFLQTAFIHGIIQHDFSKERWTNFINLVSQKAITYKYFDYYNEHYKFETLKEQSNAAELTNYVNREFVYNFYAPEYENLLRGRNFNDIDSACFYNIYQSYNLKTDDDIQLASLGGLIDRGYVESLIYDNQLTTNIKKYYEEYVKSYSTKDGKAALQIPEKNILYISEEMNSLATEAAAKFVPAPMYMIAKIKNRIENQNNISKKLLEFGNINNSLIGYINQSERYETNNFIIKDETITEQPIKTYNISDWTSFVTDIETSAGDSSVNNSLIKNALKVIKYLNSKDFRSYDNLLLKPADSEVIFYKIEKRINDYNGSLIEKFYITPGNNELINFIDSQVKYDIEYFYTITAYTLVYGSSYEYNKYYGLTDNRELERDLANGVYKIKITSKPSFRIIEMPVGKFHGAVREAPYTSPSVDFLYKNNSFSLGFFEPKNDMLEKIYPIENGEYSRYKEIASSQENNDPESILYLKPATENVILQIYRTSNYPTDFLAFQGKLYKQFEIKNGFDYIEDSIVTDKKYYYMFRYLNIHGIPSLPSNVCEVYIENQEGTLILHKNVIDMEPSLESVSIKDFKRYLLVRPSQIQLKPRNLEDQSSIQLGPEIEALYGRNVIFKIKSKKTNRTISFKVKANINKKK